MPERRPDDFWHNGFFFRLGAGVGVAHDRLDTDAGGYSFAKHGGKTGAASGLAFASEVAVGGGLGDGLSLGLGGYTVVTPSSTASATDGASYEFELSQLALVGPFVALYPNPARGLFFQGSLGVSTFVMGFAKGDQPGLRPAQAHTSVGLGGMLGGGYEWFVGRQWSAGVAGRLLWAATAGNDADGTSWGHRTLGLSVLMVLTRN